MRHHVDLRTPGSWLAAQVQTNVPDVIPSAKPDTVEHIRIHGAALESNLEGDAVDRDVIVFAAAELSERSRGAAIPSFTHCTVTLSGRSSGRMKSMCPKPSKARSREGAREMIVVLPDSKTIYNGSMYSSSRNYG